MEPKTAIIILSILAFPYILYGWLFGFTLVKKLIEKEWRKQKGLLSAYERLSSEDRMNLDLQRVKTEPQKEVKIKESAWLGSPTPREEIVMKNEQVLKEGLLEHPQEGKWETPKEAEKTVLSKEDILARVG